METLKESLVEASHDNFETFNYQWAFTAELESIWSPPAQEELPKLDAVESVSYDIAFSLDEPGPTTWQIALTPTFSKSVAGVDKKLQGRVLGAIADLSESPMEVHGDTVKPLVGAGKGLWRYRVGDYRLVYEPRQSGRVVVLLLFAARGGVYD